jgi:hypothetical protein
MISPPGSCVWVLRNGRTNTWDLASLIRFLFPLRPLRPPREACKDFAPTELGPLHNPCNLRIFISVFSVSLW